MNAFCVKCHKQREIKNAKEITTKNGRHAITGVCLVCVAFPVFLGGISCEALGQQ
jgi:hypothetical protein